MAGMAVEKVKVQKPVSAELIPEQPVDEENRRQLDPIVAEIPMQLWDKETEARLKLYLDTELTLAEGERSDFIDDLARYKVAYAAPMPDKPKNFPIANASNLTMPVINLNGR